MPPYVLSSIDISEAYRVGEVQQAAFAEGDLTLAALSRVSKDAYIDWCAQSFSNPSANPGYRAEYVCARDTETGVIGGWALWAIPLAEGEEWTSAATKVPLPDGVDEFVWSAFFAGLAVPKGRIIGDRKRWGAWLFNFYTSATHADYIRAVDPCHPPGPPAAGTWNHARHRWLQARTCSGHARNGIFIATGREILPRPWLHDARHTYSDQRETRGAHNGVRASREP